MNTSVYNIDALAVENGIEKYWEYVKRNNPANDKPYHNLWHTSCVVHYCNEIAEDEEIDSLSKKRLLLAAMFHDFGHHSKDDFRNVTVAKEMFKIAVYILEPEEYGSLELISRINEVCDIIDATKYPYSVPEDKLTLSQKIIRDADLLQWTEATITEHTFAGLAKEMEIPLNMFLPKNKQFILNIKYHTDWANHRASLMLPHQLEKLEVFEKMIAEMGHKRIVLVARAASGKDFLRNKFEARGFKPSISITTRPPRPGEVEGKDYFFITESKAEQMIENDEFYEYVRFNNWLYGTTKKQFMEDDVFIMTPAGVSKIHQEDRKSCFIIYLDIPEDTRKLRLLQRQMPGDTVDRRIAADEEDFRNFKDYDMRVTNPDF